MKKIMTLCFVVLILLNSVNVCAFAADDSAVVLYEEGMKFFEAEEFGRAFARFQISGDVKGYAPAQNMLGVCYRDGLGTEQNTLQAEKYFRLSADQGYAPAKENLAELEKVRKEEQDSRYDTAVIKDAVCSLINEQRAENGLSALSADSLLQAAADERAAEVAISYFQTDPDGTSRKTAIPDNTYLFTGENLCCLDDFGNEEDLAASCVQSWMDSQKMKANLLNPYFLVTATGITVSESKVFIVQLFGTPY